jgi:hypothetical protein
MTEREWAMKDFSSECSNWQVESGRFLVSGDAQIELRIVIDGLKFVGQMRVGERAEVQLSWDGTMGFVEWVHHLPLPED